MSDELTPTEAASTALDPYEMTQYDLIKHEFDKMSSELTPSTLTRNRALNMKARHLAKVSQIGKR